MKKISPSDLVPMDIFLEEEPIQIDLIYSNKNHPRNVFNAALYHKKSRLWAHKDIAAITLLTARKLHQEYGYILEIQDCLRTVDAQQAMEDTAIVKAHPEWLEEGKNRLLAPPGAGGHPRGMAIDVRVLDVNRDKIDMGTEFDHFYEESARDYTGLSDEALNNRKILENAFLESADQLELPFLGLPSEWWDFRFPASYSKEFEPLKDIDLPLQMQMTGQIPNNIPDFSQEHFDKLAKTILNIVDENI